MTGNQERNSLTITIRTSTPQRKIKNSLVAFTRLCQAVMATSKYEIIFKTVRKPNNWSFCIDHILIPFLTIFFVGYNETMRHKNNFSTQNHFIHHNRKSVISMKTILFPPSSCKRFQNNYLHM